MTDYVARNHEFLTAIASVEVAYEHAESVINELHAENAKLRELVQALNWCTEQENTWQRCERCPLQQSTAEPECEVRMRELGIEVDE